MHIIILAPSDKSFISKFLPNYEFELLPIGYTGAPFIGTLISGLLNKNHHVTAITTSIAVNDAYNIKSFSNNNFKWVVVPSRPHSFNMNGNKIGRIIDFYAYEINEMSKVLKEIKPNFVHAHWSYEFAGAAIKSDYPCLITVHDNAYQVFRYFRNFYRFGRLLMAEIILRKVRFSSTVSPYMLSYTQKRCKEVRVIPNLVEIELAIADIKLLIDQKSTSLTAPKIIMINNGWNDRKNGKLGLQAFKKFQKTYPDASIQLFGVGSEINGPANKDAVELGLINTKFYGSVNHAQLKAELKKAHLLLHPALEESFGVVLIEAMSFGIPVIGGKRSGAVPWVINNNNLVVDVNNVGKLCEKMIDLFSDYLVYKKTSINCYNNVVSRFSTEAVVNEYLKYYSHILKKMSLNETDFIGII